MEKLDKLKKGLFVWSSSLILIFAVYKFVELIIYFDFEYFLSYLSHYEINGKEERCTETGKARKLSTLRAFYKHFFNNQKIINKPTKMPAIAEKAGSLLWYIKIDWGNISPKTT